MAGKLIVHGINMAILGTGAVGIYIDQIKVGSVKKKETIEIPFEKDGVFTVRCGMNKGKNLNIYADGVTEIQCNWNRFTGKYSYDVISEPQKATEIKAQKEAAYKKEHRMRCNVCGNIFCYTQKDLDDNVTMAIAAGVAGMGQIASALGGSRLDMLVSNETANSASSKVKDYTKCPNCNSSDLAEIVDGEGIQSGTSASTENNKTNTMEELKLLKELLDIGIVTQEEFDMKKRQLLGL